TSSVNGEFTEGSLQDAGINTSIIESMDSNIINNIYPNIHSVLIWKSGKLVFEKYYAGSDENWGTNLGIVTHHKDSLHDIRSITKSVTSACIGLAIEQGKIKSVDQKIFDFYPEYRHLDTGLKSSLTIKHLLTMTTGQVWNEEIPYTDSANSETRMDRSNDPIAYALSQPIEHLPGSQWKYNGGSTELLAFIIQKATGKRVDSFAFEYLLRSLGIKKFKWHRYNNGLPAAASGLRLTPRDLLKFGVLYINEGGFNGKQILPAAWVKEATTFHVTRKGLPGNKDFGYGYQFWVETLPSPNQHIEVAVGVGNGGQVLYIDKTNRMVTLVMGGNYNNWKIKNNSDKLVTDFIYRALK
ncbi:MAG TPA: serine hydrolase, partial [Chitinophagaceae bacterium]|nr:serine hydrolase [Chitinophagaceae bacterium]